MLGAQGTQLLVDRLDLSFEVVDQRQAGVDGLTPGLGNRQTVQPLAPGDAEQIRDRTRVAES